MTNSKRLTAKRKRELGAEQEATIAKNTRDELQEMLRSARPVPKARPAAKPRGGQRRGGRK